MYVGRGSTACRVIHSSLLSRSQIATVLPCSPFLRAREATISARIRNASCTSLSVVKSRTVVMLLPMPLTVHS
jgi:hypothetical protein